MFETNHKTNVALDIETSGLRADGEVTVFGILVEQNGERQSHVVLNTGGRSANTEDLRSTVEDISENRANLVTVMDERSLLDEVRSLMFERVDKEHNRLVAFNGQTWSGGFDIPFLRSRSNSYGVEWPLRGYDYVDLYPIVSKRFHTALPDANGDLTDHNDLVRSHRFLCGPEYEFDPYESSEQAVTDHHNAEFVPLIQHNVADIFRTLDLAEVAEQYASPKHMQTDRL